MTPDELQQVFEWCRVHPSNTLEDAQKHFFPGSNHYINHKWVLLQFTCMHASKWEEQLLLTDLEYELLSTQVLDLGEINGRHSDVEAEWHELEKEVITDPLEISAKIQEGNTCLASESNKCSTLLSDLRNAYDKFMGFKYMQKRLDKFFPPNPERQKPNTNLLNNEYGEFESKRFHKLIIKSCDALHKKGLFHNIQDIWQRGMVEFIDHTFGDTSAVLSIEQPWLEL